MKSIKEFATELAQDKYMPVQTFQAVMAGANYVLDEIEKSLQEFSNYEDSLIISRIIEQLKKQGYEM